MLRRKKTAEEGEGQVEKKDGVLEVTASMTGTLTFKDPVNLRIDGKFDGELDTRGTLSIGEHAVVKARIRGESISVSGRVTGNIKAVKSLSLEAPAVVTGDVETPSLHVASGAVLNGAVRMNAVREGGPAVEDGQTDGRMSLQEVASYLEVEGRVIEDWARQGKIPASRRGDEWTFSKARVDQWIADEKVRI